MPQYDVGIIGGGIVGLATARALNHLAPQLRLVVLEKENAVARHQTGHNSGVIHSGIYYRPGSLKAKLCVDGARQMVEFCGEHGIPFSRIGKVIIATRPEELPHLDKLYERAIANGVPGVEKINRERLIELEPHAAGLCAIHSPNTAIVDYTQVAQTIAGELLEREADIQTGARVNGIRQNERGGMVIETTKGAVQTRSLINCAGLYSDQIARLSGAAPSVRIIPFRGEYYFVKPASHHLVRRLIYPLVDPQLPFLGVHFTRTIHGEVEAGPNAVFALAREGYGWSRVNLSELGTALSYSGFWKMARHYWRTGVFEFYRSLNKSAFVRSLQSLVPEIADNDLERGGSGVRAQALDSNGALVDDFAFLETQNALHVLNAPSPAATASLAIGQYIAARAQSLFQFAK